MTTWSFMTERHGRHASSSITVDVTYLRRGPPLTPRATSCSYHSCQIRQITRTGSPSSGRQQNLVSNPYRHWQIGMSSVNSVKFSNSVDMSFTAGICDTSFSTQILSGLVGPDDKRFWNYESDYDCVCRTSELGSPRI